MSTYGKNNKASAEFKYGTPWSFTPQSITFNGNGNTGGSTATQYVRNGVSSNLTANGFTKTGYSFAGWATTSSGSVAYANQASVNIDADLSLYAKWTAKDYTITLNDNGGSGGDGTHAVTYDAATGSLTNAPTKTGYTFGGYWTSTNSGTTLTTKIFNADLTPVQNVSDYTDNTSDKKWVHDGDVTLYAEWTINNYTVTWKVNGETWTPKTTTGEGTDGSANANYNTAWSSLTLPTDPDPAEDGCGNRFMGWTTTENYESDSAPSDLMNSVNKASKTGVKITDDTTFYAVFADYGE